MNAFYGRDILSVDQFTVRDIALVQKTADRMRQMVKSRGGSDVLRGRIMTALFYEPSSRTFGSFIASMQRLGGGVVPIQGVTYSSVSKGESLPDTVRTFASYSDLIVLRHPEIGSARIAADFSDKPVINAGDGVGEHPTQALLDYYTIHRHFGDPVGKSIALVGDLLNGRTVHSLAKVLSLYSKLTLYCVSPEILRMPSQIIELLRERGSTVHEAESIDEVITKTDVLYITRVQKERFVDLDMYETLKHRYIITPELMKSAKSSAILMHPLPRVGEIAMDVDLDPRSLYITEQMKNGLYVRMALISLILSPT